MLRKGYSDSYSKDGGLGHGSESWNYLSAFAKSLSFSATQVCTMLKRAWLCWGGGKLILQASRLNIAPMVPRDRPRAFHLRFEAQMPTNEHPKSHTLDTPKQIKSLQSHMATPPFSTMPPNFQPQLPNGKVPKASYIAGIIPLIHT